jgi:non-specific serine/threonine protein kinase/serine/threonine-protein kinase
MRHSEEEIDALVREARRLADAERGAYLDRACGGDAELRAEVERLLGSSGEAPTATGGSAPSLPGTEGVAEKPGAILGQYRLIQVLGQGGFGTVFLAEQEKPIRREVALKIVKLGMDTGEVIARFDAERQALAMMDHPGIARVFDAGATSSGRPYFVMELVRGVPITRYCDEHDLSLEDRLQLFNEVCAAVQHAHQKGIIHRDIKPSNVLVTEHEGRPFPKVIDFGIAKATDQAPGERNALTAMGQIIGTPAYMSPEQAGLDDLDIDTRSDVYSLGVLLYELLTGTVPFDTTTIRGAFWAELQRMIREQEPPKPSTRVVSMEGKRATAPARDVRTAQRIGATLRGDLDWIVMKALEKDRRRRYESARELASDIERHMRSEPVTAGPPSATYRMRKFVRRHRMGVGAAVAAVLVLITFAATMAVQARRIAVERDRANREREVSDRVADFQASMLQRIRPFDMGKSIVSDLRGSLDARLEGRQAPAAERQAALASFDRLLGEVNPTDTARRVLDAQILRPAADAVTAQFEKEPETEARMRLALARTYRSLGLPDKALPQAERAVEVADKTLGPESRQALLSRGIQAIALWDLGRMDECEKILSAAVPVWTRVYGPDDPDAIKAKVALGVLSMGIGRSADARKMFEEALAAQERTLGREHKDLVNTLGNLATVLINGGHDTEAAPYLERALAIQKKNAGVEDGQALSTQQRLAEVYQRMGRPQEAEKLQREAVDTLNRVQGERHPQAIAGLATLATLYRMQSRFAEAEALDRKALEMRRTILGDDHPETLRSINELAMTISAAGRHKEAEPLFVEALERTRKGAGPEAGITLERTNNLATNYWFQGRYQEASKLYEQVLEVARRTQGEESEATVFAMSNLAVMKAKLGQLDEAQALDEKAVAIRTKTFGPEHRNTLQSLAGLGDVAFRRGRYDEAAKTFASLVSGWTKALGPDDPMVFEASYNLASAYKLLGRKDEATALLAKLVESRRRVLGPSHSQTLDTMQALADLYVDAGRIDDARPLLTEAAKSRRAAAAGDGASPADMIACASFLLSCPIAELRDPKAALDLARKACERTKDEDPEFLRTLARASYDTGNRAQAVEAQRRALALLSDTSPDRTDYQKELKRYRGAPRN